jgi:NADH-quinone oxidoreductase subunit G
MPKFTIDGKVFEYEGEHKLLQFALDNGVEIPYFCYHPAMSVPTNCRMCLVEVGFPVKDRVTGELKLDDKGEPQIMWGRKPNTSCNTPLAPDMVVRTNKTSAVVKEMQQGVLEYMLVNHPLDCPICDQAGECPLQIWTYKYGPEGSRMEARKGHKPKRIDLGPNVVLDAERCINCTRCVRFTEEISGSWQLSIMGRGEKNYPMTAPGQPFDDAYSMNTIDICPVGALTSKDFRFKARVWEMSYSPSVCNGCSNGCSTDVWVRDNEVLRLTPRDNMAVNQYWMCDEGRLSIDQYNKARVSGARYRGDVPADLDEALARVGSLLNQHKGRILFVGSPFASLESNYALRELSRAFGDGTVHYQQHVEKGWGDNFLRKDDRTPNAAACEMLGFKSGDLGSLMDGAEMVYLLEDGKLLSAYAANLRSKITVVHATQYQEILDHCSIVLPAATGIEAEGTYVNHKGTAQVTRLAKEIARMTPEMWMRLPKSRLDKAAVAVDKWRHLENIYDVLPSWLLIAKAAKSVGNDMGWADHKDIFAKLKNEFEVLKDLKVSNKVPKEAFKFTQYDFAVK